MYVCIRTARTVRLRASPGTGTSSMPWVRAAGPTPGMSTVVTLRQESPGFFASLTASRAAIAAGSVGRGSPVDVRPPTSDTVTEPVIGCRRREALRHAAAVQRARLPRVGRRLLEEGDVGGAGGPQLGVLAYAVVDHAADRVVAGLRAYVELPPGLRDLDPESAALDGQCLRVTGHAGHRAIGPVRRARGRSSRLRTDGAGTDNRPLGRREICSGCCRHSAVVEVIVGA